MTSGHRPLRLPPYPAIADHGLVGDGRSAALLTSEGVIDWWCPQRFDAPSACARLLDDDIGGYYALAPPSAHRREFGYVDGTNVLRALFVTTRGRFCVTTCMPHAEADHGTPRGARIVQLVEGLEGAPDVTVELAPRFDYAREAPRAAESDAGSVVFRGAREAMRLSASLDLRAPTTPTAGHTFQLAKGERHAFVLEHVDAPRAPPPVHDALAFADVTLARELSWWREWIGRCTYEGAYAAAVHRSMLGLKLLQYEPAGSFVAAATMGLPEIPGGADNWDYRHAWLRDGSFIVMAFETRGYANEATRFRRWLSEVVKRDAPDRIQMLYRVDGERDLVEETLDHFHGWRGARPVRLGNAAAEQHQLDTYGEVMMCYHRAPRLMAEQGEFLWPALEALVDAVCDRWQERDSGIWELRGEKRHYTYSKAMGWLAIQRGLDVAQTNGFDAPRERWQGVADEIRTYIERECWSERAGSYTRAAGDLVPDSAVLLFPLFGYQPPRDARMRVTLDWVERHLAGHSFVNRHLREEDLGTEGAFLAAGFWLAHDLAHLGRVEEARRYVDAALRVGGPLGLLPEEADVVSGEGLGNHPQALSHLSLVLAAYAINESERRGGVAWDAPSTKHASARRSARGFTR